MLCFDWCALGWICPSACNLSVAGLNWKAGCIERCLSGLEGGKGREALPILTHCKNLSQRTFVLISERTTCKMSIWQGFSLWTVFARLFQTGTAPARSGSKSAGHCVPALYLAPFSLAPLKFADRRFVPLKSAFSKFASCKFAPCKEISLRSAYCKLARPRLASLQSHTINSLSLHFSKVSLKEKMPSGIKQVISKPFEHKVVAQLAS